VLCQPAALLREGAARAPRAAGEQGSPDGPAGPGSRCRDGGVAAAPRSAAADGGVAAGRRPAAGRERATTMRPVGFQPSWRSTP